MFVTKSMANCPIETSHIDNTLAYEQLVSDNSVQLFQYGFWLCNDQGEAERLVQNAFRRVWKSMDSNMQNGYSKLQLFRNLHQIYHRYHSNPLRKVKTRRSESIKQNKTDSKAYLFYSTLEKMATEIREPLVLQLISGFNCEEIASICNLSTQEVKILIHSAKQQIIEESSSNA